MPSSRLVLAAALVLALVPAGGAAAQEPSASFAQLEGARGCLAEPVLEEDGCGEGRALRGGSALLIAPGGADVYVAAGGGRGEGADAITTWRRDAATGVLTRAGCHSDTGGDGRFASDGACTDADALADVQDLAMSPDGRFLYAVAEDVGAVSWFERDPASGALTQRGCLRRPYAGVRCGRQELLAGASGVAVSPDGAHVYVTGRYEDTVVAFARDRDSGALAFAGCVSHNGSDGSCTDGTALVGASDVVVSPDGRTVVVTAGLSDLGGGAGAVNVFRRDAATGLLSPLTCLIAAAPSVGPCRSARAIGGARAAALSPDGRSLYVLAAEEDGALAAFAVEGDGATLRQVGCATRAPGEYPDEDDEGEGEGDEGEGEGDEGEGEGDEGEGDEEGAGEPTRVPSQLETCDPAPGLRDPGALAVSPDGRAVFAVGGDDAFGTITAFRRDPEAGTLAAAACVEERPPQRLCSLARGVDATTDLAVTEDGRNLYAVSREGTLTSFASSLAVARSATARSQAATAVALRVACPAARRAGCRGALRVLGVRAARGAAPAGRVRLASGQRSTVARRLPPRAMATLRRGRPARVRVRVSEEGGRTSPLVRSVLVRPLRRG